MAIKTYRPTTQTLRYRTTLSSADLTTDRPHKPLTEPKQRQGGRRNSGDVTMRFRGGGHKRKLRLVDFKRDKTGIPATVISIEYDPNRSARIALLAYADGEKRYILQPDGLKAGAKIVSGPDADILVGNALPLKNIPPGTTIHNLELRPGKGAELKYRLLVGVILHGQNGGLLLWRQLKGDRINRQPPGLRPSWRRNQRHKHDSRWQPSADQQPLLNELLRIPAHFGTAQNVSVTVMVSV